MHEEEFPDAFVGYKEHGSVCAALAALSMSPGKDTVTPCTNKPTSLPEPEGYDDVVEYLYSDSVEAIVQATQLEVVSHTLAFMIWAACTRLHAATVRLTLTTARQPARRLR